jgi:hypothetical protein
MSRLGGAEVKSPTNETYVVSGRLLGGTGVVSIKAGKAFSVKYVSAGRYTVTPDVNYPYIVGGSCSIMSATNATLGWTCGVKAYTVNVGSGTAMSVDLQTENAGTPTDLGSAEELWFTLVLARTATP